MKLPIKSHQLIAHWVPGLLVLMTLVLSYYKWSYLAFFSVVASQGSIATITTILLSIVAFMIGEFVDCIRDLLEYAWDKITKSKIDCDCLFSPEMTEKRDSYWTYYVMSCNIVITSVLCLGLYLLDIIKPIPGMTISGMGWTIGIAVVLVFTANACTLRKEIVEITTITKETSDTGETVKKFTLPHYGVYARIQPSELHGVGVFAIRDIPKDTYMFTGDNSEMVWVNKSAVESLEPDLKKLYADFCVITPDKYHCPDNFNNMNVGWFLNESKTDPNVGCDNNLDFYALRDIRKDEELTLNYSTFSDEPE